MSQTESQAKNNIFYRTCKIHEGHHDIKKCNNGRVGTQVFREKIRKTLYQYQNV